MIVLAPQQYEANVDEKSQTLYNVSLFFVTEYSYTIYLSVGTNKNIYTHTKDKVSHLQRDTRTHLPVGLHLPGVGCGVRDRCHRWVLCSKS